MTHSHKQISEDGSARNEIQFNEFLMNEEFIAMLDYYVVTSLRLSVKSSEAKPFRTFYCDREAVYKALDGQQDRRNSGAGRVAALVSRGCKQEKGKASFGPATAQPSAASQDDL